MHAHSKPISCVFNHSIIFAANIAVIFPRKWEDSRSTWALVNHTPHCMSVDNKIRWSNLQLSNKLFWLIDWQTCWFWSFPIKEYSPHVYYLNKHITKWPIYSNPFRLTLMIVHSIVHIAGILLHDRFIHSVFAWSNK